MKRVYLLLAVSIIAITSISCKKNENPTAPVYQNRILTCLLKDTTSTGQVGNNLDSFPVNSNIFIEMEFEKEMADSYAVFLIYNDNVSKYAPVYQSMVGIPPGHFCKADIFNPHLIGNYRIEFRFNTHDSIPYATKTVKIY